jgi:hypothetical protein
MFRVLGTVLGGFRGAESNARICVSLPNESLAGVG